MSVSLKMSKETFKFRLKQATKAFQVDKKLGKQWEVGSEPRFLFIITPPYSGSTALAQLLNSAPRTALLEERGEGQWLVPGLGNSDRWERNKAVNWEAVKTVWFKRVALLRALVQEVDLFIEKSPPNMVRLGELLEAFPNHSLLAFNRDPYANCSSIFHRFHSAEALTSEKRKAVMESLAKTWLLRSELVRKETEKRNILSFTYEDFCENTEACLARLQEVEPLLQEVDARKEVLVKDYAPQKIENQNARQIAKLKPEDLKVISSVLAQEQLVMSHFGYDIL